MNTTANFIKYPRINQPTRGTAVRIGDFKEYTDPYSDDELHRQSSRCMDCGIPYCHTSGCPLYNLIPEWISHLNGQQFQAAFERLSLTNNLPEITGRICHAPCESACCLSLNTLPVAIKALELHCIESAFTRQWIIPETADIIHRGKRIAIIGSGPSGLAAAQQLRRKGYTVVVFEQSAKPGGCLRYGIPEFRLEKWVLDRRIELLKQEGVIFETNVIIGQDLSGRYLKRLYDAIILATGQKFSRNGLMNGDSFGGEFDALDYIRNTNDVLSDDNGSREQTMPRGKKVLVIGADRIGLDCARTALRHAAQSVVIIDHPQTSGSSHHFQSLSLWNQIPPRTLLLEAIEEGCLYDDRFLLQKLSGKNQRVHCAHLCFKPSIHPNMQQPPLLPSLKQLSESEFCLDVDCVFFSPQKVAETHCELIPLFDATIDGAHGSHNEKSSRTQQSALFCASSPLHEPTSVAHAIWQGREVAAVCHRFLEGTGEFHAPNEYQVPTRSPCK
ncbi:MAG: FAD-dependent oxidoreductase [Chitinivibrionales bacterium]|nr:FAD-dependent oxidoreductase [Chitinivibrionales bacterium]